MKRLGGIQAGRKTPSRQEINNSMILPEEPAGEGLERVRGKKGNAKEKRDCCARTSIP